MSASDATTAWTVDGLRKHKAIFDNTWTLTVLLAATIAMSCWYFRLVQVRIAPIIWTLAALGLAHFALNSQSHRVASVAAVRRFALTSQLLGTLLIGIAWQPFGGVQQPLFPLLVVLPLITGTLVLGFWQQQIATLALLALLGCGALLAPQSNSFIEERYGISIVSPHALPSWIPRSRIVFPDVNTSPAYDLVLLATVAVIAVSVSTTARALVRLCRNDAARMASLQDEVARLNRTTTELVTRAPVPMLLVSNTGRILLASARLSETFDLAETRERFLLDAIAFTYPTVIKQLLTRGGEEIHSAAVRGRNVALRLRAEVLQTGAARVTWLSIESCDDLGWRGALDALDEPVFAVDRRGRLAYLNRSAVAIFGPNAEGAPATEVFPADTTRWWEIAPLESARRLVTRDDRRYIASIHRERIIDSLEELSFVHMHERTPSDAFAAS
jgi:PAS domain-containing protein